jgi:hypothetical protein
MSLLPQAMPRHIRLEVAAHTVQLGSGFVFAVLLASQDANPPSKAAGFKVRHYPDMAQVPTLGWTRQTDSDAPANRQLRAKN